ncbi:MAG: hypothetical protein AAF701_03100 [Pseudomonadota bacterium]
MDRHPPFWDTLNLEMKLRVTATGVAAVALGLSVLIDHPILFGIWISVFIYWILRALVGRVLFMLLITKSDGSLTSHIFSEGIKRSPIFAAGVAICGGVLIVYADYDFIYNEMP